jgi:alpha-amylase/alpha-mannosidase (GH57 family)
MTEPRYIIIHGHFYQPPRESPWTGIITNEPSAAPFPNWNERILSECYNANAHAQIMEGTVVHIRNNYEALNFDFGPTLCSWVQAHGKAAYRAIRRADELSNQRRSGHGNAIAQAYSHSILPLLNGRGRELEIAWGVQEFAARFGRLPEGLWLPECAVDAETLVTVARAGIRFVILGSSQGRFSRPGQDCGPFLWQQDDGLTLAIFRFDHSLSGAVAFSDVLRDGAGFGAMLTDSAFALAPGQALLVATDGETFGHHKRTGAAELARAVRLIEQRDDVVLTNCGEFLASHPATGTFEIDSPSAWSCAHGVERWRSNCGCRMEPHSNQDWRGPLRATMDFVRNHCEMVYDRFASSLVSDSWTALKEAGRAFVDPSAAVLEEFFTRHHTKDEAAREQLLRLFEMQRAAHAGLTSCAWFFDDFGGLEGRVALRWAARAIELAAELMPSIEPEVLQQLRAVRSNRREIGDAATLYLSIKTREARGRV